MTNSTPDEKSRPKEGQATGHMPSTPVLKPVVTNGDVGPEGKIVQTTKNQSTGHINTPGTYVDYK